MFRKGKRVTEGVVVSEQQTLEMDETLEQVVFYCLEEAKNKLSAGEDCVPFTVVVDSAREQMFVESHPGEDVMTCRASAHSTVRTSSAFSTHYAFCYDGFLMTDDGQVDAIIVEAATRDMDAAYVIGLSYEEKPGGPEFSDTPAYIDDTELFYDAEAVKAAKAQEQSADDDEMKAASDALNSALGSLES